MAIPITPITAPALAPPLTSSKVSAATGEFSSLLSGAVARMDQSAKGSEASIDKFLSGENQEIHQTVLATQQNELQFELFLQVRNKMVQAYQEVMRMQL
jgi:flagellar hook-basal body complex protein FliE